MTPETGPEPVRIRCAADLFSVLSGGPLESQAAVLQSILNDPAKPMALGPHDGEDFIDLLIRLIGQNSGSLRRLQLACLASYEDPRTSEFMKEEFSKSRDAKSVLFLARRLAMEKGAEFFRPFIWHDTPEQALAAARYCCEIDREQLSSKEKLRIAIIVDRDFDPPPISTDTLEHWIQELQGRYRLATRQLAETRQEEVLFFWDHYSELAGSEQEWLVSVTAKLKPSLLQEKLPRILTGSNVPFAMVEQAVMCAVDLPPTLLANEDPLVRAAAIAVGLADEQLENYLKCEVSINEAVAATGRCELPRLLTLLSDNRWQVRATATDFIAEHPEPPIPELRRKASSTVLGERIAAVEVLRRIGDDEWLLTLATEETKS